MMPNKDEYYMDLAILEAKKAEKLGEVPIGAIIVCDDKIISTGYNERETTYSTLAHAELTAIARANEINTSWRLENWTLYVTLEPCPMCAVAIIQSRIQRVVYGASDYKSGCAGTLMNILVDKKINHQVDLTTGVKQKETSALLTNFFKTLRNKK